MTLENETNENTTEPTKPVETPADQSTAEPMVEQGAAPTAKITDPEMAEFESLIGSYLSGIVQHEVDTIIKVPIVQIHSDNVLVDLGDKAEGLIDIQEFFDAKGNITISVGEVIDVQVLGRDDETGLIQVSYKRARSHVARQRLVQAFEKGLPISGRITRAVKSGLIVDLGMDCFMPASQISDSRVENIEEWVGKEVDVLVVDYDERKNRAVVSRRRLVEQGKKKALAEALERLREGTEVQGQVANIVNFGAFPASGRRRCLPAARRNFMGSRSYSCGGFDH